MFLILHVQLQQLILLATAYYSGLFQAITSYYTFSPLSKMHATRTATIVCLREVSNIERVRENNR